MSQKLSVFVRFAPTSDLRAALSGAVLAALMDYPDVDIFPLIADISHPSILRDSGQVLAGDQFWNTSRRYADKHAASPIYCVLDDDQLPLGVGFFERGIRALVNHPDYMMLSSISVNGEVFDPHADDDEVFSAASCGTPYFARAASLAGCFPDCEIGVADLLASTEITKQGKIGFIRSVRHNHLGYGYSQAIPAWSRADGPVSV